MTSLSSSLQHYLLLDTYWSTTLPYEEAKQSFHSSNPGTTLPHIYLVSLPALSSLVLYYAYRQRPQPENGLRRLLHEYVVLVLPLLLGITICSRWPLLFNGGVVLRAATVYWQERRASALTTQAQPAERRSKPLPPSKAQPASEEPRGLQKPSPPAYHYPPLTTYRAHLMLMTLLSILAVDFPAFPRSLGKTTSHGYSLMDVGVGSFVLSSGLAASRSGLSSRPSSTSKTLRRQLPLLGLALARVVAVKALRYPEQVEEYGVHWNFFCTLFLLPLLYLPFKPLLRVVARSGGAAWTAAGAAVLGMGVSLGHQMWLDRGVGEWALGEDRHGLLAQNKEGIVSLPGYLAIYLFGSALGLLLPLSLPPAGELSASDVLERVTPLVSAFGAAFMGARYYALGGGASRRLANTQYVLHTAMYNALFICAYILLDAYYFPSPSSSRSKDATPDVRSMTPAPTSQLPPPVPRTPPLFRALNAHPLTVFLLANLLTGAVNLAIPTMYVRDWAAVGVLAVYGLVVCGVGWYWP